jgi:hypothetical protein
MIEVLGAMLRMAGMQVGTALDAAFPALGVLAILILAVVAIAVVASTLVRVPRSRAVGGRSRRHAVLLATLPPSSHPDAAGHTRSRAPGALSPVA